MKVLVTGTAGFIGSALAMRLLSRGDSVVGVDNVCDYYDVNLKRARLRRNAVSPRYRHVDVDIADLAALAAVFDEFRPERVVHLAAQAGVRYASQNPHAYGVSNLSGFLNILESCRKHRVEHLVYASTSSVYGANAKLPASERDPANHPLSLYAATKRANELMAHSYAHLYGIPTTGLRFFTVYGPWGRPDMSPFLFAKSILSGEPIRVFNHGKHSRDFTYIDDIVEGVSRVLDRAPQADPAWDAMQPDPASSKAPFQLYNIGNQSPVPLLRYIEVLEACLGKRARLELLPMQPGDVADTSADVSRLAADTGFAPSTTLETGISLFVDWYRSYFNV